MENIVNELDVVKLDENMRIENFNGQPFQWYSPMKPPFTLSGFPWILIDKVYRRLPVNTVHKLSEAVDLLADCTAGGQIRFTTSSTKMAIRVQLAGRANMYHMPATGLCGFDCYLDISGKQFFCGSAQFDQLQTEYECLLYESVKGGMVNVTLNFPLYQGVKEVLVGLDPGAVIHEPPKYIIDMPVVFYGTSITQGGCASRPGMAYTNIISRKLNIECVNLGFSGSGRGEPELARIISEINNPACIVLDYEANVPDGLMEKTLKDFIRILRESHPLIPILVISKIRYGLENYNEERLQKRLLLKEIQQRTVEGFKELGDMNIYFYDGSELLGEDFDECSVDGAHPTDLGFMKIAEKLSPVLGNILFK